MLGSFLTLTIKSRAILCSADDYLSLLLYGMIRTISFLVELILYAQVSAVECEEASTGRRQSFVILSLFVYNKHAPSGQPCLLCVLNDVVAVAADLLLQKSFDSHMVAALHG